MHPENKNWRHKKNPGHCYFHFKVFSGELLSNLQPVLVQGLTLKCLQIQDLAFLCVELGDTPLCPDCQGLSPWQHNPLAHQPLLPGFPHLQTFQECTLNDHPGH